VPDILFSIVDLGGDEVNNQYIWNTVSCFSYDSWRYQCSCTALPCL